MERVKIRDRRQISLLILITFIPPEISQEHKKSAHNNGSRALPLNGFFKTLFLAIKMCTGFATDVKWRRRIYGEEQSFKKPFKGRALLPSLCPFFLCSDVYFWFSPQAVC